MSETLSVPRPRPRFPIVTTWGLWARLLVPPDHPLFKRARRSDPLTLPIRAVLGWLIPLGGGLACCGTWIVLVRAGSAAPVFLLGVSGLASTIYASRWAVETSAAIAHERMRHTYDVLGTTPAGTLGVHWALCAASLHRRETLDLIETLRRATTMILIFILMLIVLLTTSLEKTLDPTALLALPLELVSLAAAIYLDHVQATVLGSLVGMAVPCLTASPAAARLWTALGFLSLQLGVLGVTLLSVALVGPLLPAVISPLVFGVLACCLLREAAVIGLWRALAHRLGAEPARLDLALG